MTRRFAYHDDFIEELASRDGGYSNPSPAIQQWFAYCEAEREMAAKRERQEEADEVARADRIEREAEEREAALAKRAAEEVEDACCDNLRRAAALLAQQVQDEKNVLDMLAKHRDVVKIYDLIKAGSLTLNEGLALLLDQGFTKNDALSELRFINNGRRMRS